MYKRQYLDFEHSLLLKHIASFPQSWMPSPDFWWPGISWVGSWGAFVFKFSHLFIHLEVCSDELRASYSGFLPLTGSRLIPGCYGISKRWHRFLNNSKSSLCLEIMIAFTKCSLATLTWTSHLTRACLICHRIVLVTLSRPPCRLFG